MHLGNGAITPECGVFALGVAAAGAGVAWHTLQRHPISRDQALTAGALGAAVFAAQMLNVAILPFSSAHLVGGVLLAWILGAPLGLLTMAAILTVQALLLGDGGFIPLGANIINMAVVPAALVAIARRWFDASTPIRAASSLGAVSFLSVVVAAGLIIGQVALFRSPSQLAGLGAFASQMLSIHAVTGVLEGGATLGLVLLIARSPQPSASVLLLPRRRSIAIGLAGLGVAILCAPVFGLVSELPDGYEAAIAHVDESGSAIGAFESTAQLAAVNASIEATQALIVSLFVGYELLVAIMATLIAGGMVWILASSSAVIRTTELPPFHAG